jgi:hypothetical protein
VLTTGTMKLCSCYVLTTFNLVFPIVSEKWTACIFSIVE